MLFETITLTLNVDHPGVAKQLIEDGRGDDGIDEQFLPVDEAFVRGDDRRAFFIAMGDELKEEIGFTDSNYSNVI